MIGSDSYEVTLSIEVGGDNPVDAVRTFLAVLADRSWGTCHFHVEDRESADRIVYDVAYDRAAGDGAITTVRSAEPIHLPIPTPTNQEGTTP